MNRRSVRLDTIARLAAADIVPDGHVFGPRSAPLGGLPSLDDHELPALVVDDPRTSDTSKSINVQLFGRAHDLSVLVVVDADDDDGLTLQLDELGDQVEATLLEDSGWVDQFERVLSVERERALSIENGRRVGALRVTFRLQWTVEHRPRLVAEAAPLDEVRVSADISPDGSAVASLVIELPQNEGP